MIDAAATRRLEAFLQRRHVSPEIIARCLRLNPEPREGEVIRGLHRTRDRDPRNMQGLATRGDCIRKYGRAWVEGLPKAAIFKQGRRAYVGAETVEDLRPTT